MNWIVYRVAPIDQGWEYLKTVRETLASLVELQDEFGAKHDVDTDAIQNFLERWESAKEAARDEGWEGDFSIEPRVFWLPTETGFQFAFAFKQGNNGDTFVMSPQELSEMASLRT